jgi:hypothetical protein
MFGYYRKDFDGWWGGVLRLVKFTENTVDANLV